MIERLYVENAHLDDTRTGDTNETDRYAHIERLADV